MPLFQGPEQDSRRGRFIASLQQQIDQGMRPRPVYGQGMMDALRARYPGLNWDETGHPTVVESGPGGQHMLGLTSAETGTDTGGELESAPAPFAPPMTSLSSALQAPPQIPQAPQAPTVTPQGQPNGPVGLPQEEAPTGSTAPPSEPPPAQPNQTVTIEGGEGGHTQQIDLATYLWLLMQQELAPGGVGNDAAADAGTGGGNDVGGGGPGGGLN